jgi:hypothetical protein
LSRLNGEPFFSVSGRGPVIGDGNRTGFWRATTHANDLPMGANIEFTSFAIRDLSKKTGRAAEEYTAQGHCQPLLFGATTHITAPPNRPFISGGNPGIYWPTVDWHARMTMRSLLEGWKRRG